MYGTAAKTFKEIVNDKKVSATVCPFKKSCLFIRTQAAVNKELQEIKGKVFSLFPSKQVFLSTITDKTTSERIGNRCKRVCSTSPMMLVVKRDVGLEMQVII